MKCCSKLKILQFFFRKYCDNFYNYMWFCLVWNSVFNSFGLNPKMLLTDLDLSFYTFLSHLLNSFHVIDIFVKTRTWPWNYKLSWHTSKIKQNKRFKNSIITFKICSAFKLKVFFLFNWKQNHCLKTKQRKIN